MSPAKLLPFIRLPKRRPGATDEHDPLFALTFTVRRPGPTLTPEERAASDAALDDTMREMARKPVDE